MRKPLVATACVFFCLRLAIAPATAQIATPAPPRTPATMAPTFTPIPGAMTPGGVAPTPASTVREGGGRPSSGSGMASVRTHIETTDHVIALTLDDGYAPDDALLAYLESNGLHGTAFIVGQVAEADPAFVRRIVDMGWMVCSHTYRHRILTRLSDAEMREEITRGADAIADIVGYHCPYFRTPGGAVDSRVAAMATELGLELIGWNASLSDSSPGVHAADQVRVALNDVRPGSILLGHWGGIHSLAVLTQVLDALKAQDYQVLSVAELLGDAPIASASPSPPPPMRLPAATTSQGEHFEWSHIMVASIPGAIGVVVSGAFGVLTRRSRRRRTKAYSQA